MRNRTIQILLYTIAISAGILIGRFTLSERKSVEETAVEEKAQVWTCSMHPQIRQDHPGTCPLCAMDLTLLEAGSAEELANPDDIQLSEEAAALANIQTTYVSRSAALKVIRLYGTIKSNETLIRSLVSHVGGRIEKLYVNYAGESVTEGQAIAQIYSPDLLNAQQELLEAQKLEHTQPALIAAAREKLRSWKLSDKQISRIEQSGQPSPTVEIVANAGGTVIKKRVEQGDYISRGGILFDLADLSVVWAVFDAYESDLPYLKTGDKVEYTMQTLPGKTYSGKISFIDPVLDKDGRTAKIRVETPNPRRELKPEMYVNAVIKASLSSGAEEIIIPKAAVLWTGKRSVVYVKRPEFQTPTFTMREIELGAALGEDYVVLSGLDEDEEIVVNGAFVIDAGAQLEGKLGMMNRE
jgi:Cu(I)/Ag(I) efflux system membrane fusion protein